jgi:hypothetical protein
MTNLCESSKRRQLKWILIVGIATVFFSTALGAQDTKPTAEVAKSPIKNSPTEVVDEVWRLATQGELLNPEGWRQACGFYTKPTPFSGKKVIVVMGNDWGPAYVLGSKDDGANVGLGYTALGQIDSELRYTPPPKTDAIKTGFLYHLVVEPTYIMMYGSDGKTLVEKKPTGEHVWQIQGSPDSSWTTVNTAIRYVLEMRDKATDPVVKKNASQTLAKLMRLH